MDMMGWTATHTGLPSLRFPSTAGVRWQVVGRAGGRSWVAGRGVGHGDDVILSDPLAPVGVAVVYHAGSESVTLTRASMGSHLITDSTGHVVSRVRWVGDDSRTVNVALSSLSTARGVADRWPLVQPPETVTMECLTDGADTATLRALAAVHDTIVVVHDQTLCRIPGCDVKPIRACVVSRASESRARNIAAATRSWSLTLEDRPGLVNETSPGGRIAPFHAPVVTWGEWQALDGGWAHRTYLELCQLVAGLPA